MNRVRLLVTAVLTVVALLPMATAAAVSDCSFVTLGTTMTLQGDCVTDSTIFVPDGFTLDGAGYSITAVDPTGGHFLGAVIANAGANASVMNLTVAAAGLVNVCDAGTSRLRGIMFDGASGVISNNLVTGINQGPSGCQEGNSIEVRNFEADGVTPGDPVVEVVVTANQVLDYQKTGIVVNGGVHFLVSGNTLGASATQANLAANGVQIGYGAYGEVSLNTIAGNQWMGASAYAATAMLVYDAGAVVVEKNHIVGNSDVGIYVLADGGAYSKNHIEDEGADAANPAARGFDWGIGNWGDGNEFSKNHVSGFLYPFDGVEGGKNKVLPTL